jgi:hypothetical protein
MRKISLVLLVFSCIAHYLSAQQKKSYTIFLHTHAYNPNQYCFCPYAIFPTKDTICSPLDSVKILVYNGKKLMRSFSSDSIGSCKSFGVVEGIYSIIFIKKGYETDTARVDLINLTKTTSGSDWCHIRSNNEASWTLRNNVLSYCTEMMLTRRRKKHGVRMVPYNKPKTNH